VQECVRVATAKMTSWWGCLQHQNAHKYTLRNPSATVPSKDTWPNIVWVCKNIVKYFWCTEGSLWEWMRSYTAVSERSPL